MSWQKYDIVFRLLAPMHIGWRKTSNLQQTRGYVTGKVFWAALTARLTREAGQGANGTAYQEVGEAVQKDFRFNYLYPALSNGNGYKRHFPWEDEFDYLFLDSYTSTALNYEQKSAADGLLHETEFIASHTRTNQPVYLEGSVYVKTTLPNSLQNWQDALNKLQFGGERGYGWGRVGLINCEEKETVSGEEVPVDIDANGRLPAHLIAENVTNVTGSIEPLIGWERNNDNKQSNWKLSKKAVICYVPGALVAANSTFTIGDNGRLQQLPNS